MTKISNMEWSSTIRNPFTGEIAIQRGHPTNQIDGWWCGTHEHVESYRFLETLKAAGIQPKDRIEKRGWVQERLGMLEDIIEIQTRDGEHRDHSFFFFPPAWGAEGIYEDFATEANYVYELLNKSVESIYDPLSGVPWVKDGKILKEASCGWWKIEGSRIEARVREGPLAQWWNETGAEDLSEIEDGWTHDHLWDVLADWQECCRFKRTEGCLPGHMAIMRSFGDEDTLGTEIGIFRCGGYHPPEKKNQITPERDDPR
jgi:hypothetical protein